jgi:glutathione S-transferase
MILYHFHTSPFGRRVRLILGMKGLSAELRDPRVDGKWWPDLHRQNPLKTVPTLVDGDRVFTDSLSIAAHLEAKVGTPSIWPRAEGMAEALEYVRLADRAIDIIIDLGMRYHVLGAQPSWPEVKDAMFARAQGALDRLGQKIEARGSAEHLVDDRWTIADIATVTTGLWFDGLPARAQTFAAAKQIVDLGWKVPAPLAAWTQARRARPDVAAILA